MRICNARLTPCFLYVNDCVTRVVPAPVCRSVRGSARECVRRPAFRRKRVFCMVVTIREVYCHFSKIAQNSVWRCQLRGVSRGRPAHATNLDVESHAEHDASVGARVRVREGRQNGARSCQNHTYLIHRLGENSTRTLTPNAGPLLQAPCGATTQSLRLRPVTVTPLVRYTTTETGTNTVSVYFCRYYTYRTRGIQPVLSLYTTTHYSDLLVHCAGSAPYKLQHTLDPARRTRHPTSAT